jgi:hypothetical protein
MPDIKTQFVPSLSFPTPAQPKSKKVFIKQAEQRILFPSSNEHNKRAKQEQKRCLSGAEP